MPARSDFSSVMMASQGPRRQSRGKSAARTFSVVLMAVFFVVLMIGLVSGAVMYRSIASAQANSKDKIMETGLLGAAMHNGDVHDALKSADGPEGPALVLVDRVDGESYETRIYLYKGNIVQEYALVGRPFEPSNANVLTRADRFSFQIDGGNVALTVDDSKMNFFFRSLQDGKLLEASQGAQSAQNAQAAQDAQDDAVVEEIIEGAPPSGTGGEPWR